MISRRRMILATGALAGTAAFWGRCATGAADLKSRRIDLVNLHTGERLEIEYVREDAYVAEALAATARSTPWIRSSWITWSMSRRRLARRPHTA
jgi:uncharacterized protein YcbK (DUF882 family)